MSLATWKAEFYPVEAHKCPKEQAVEHSLRKWRGMRADALARHDVTADCGKLKLRAADGHLCIDCSSCALCEHYVFDGCKKCPLARSRGGWACDSRMPSEHLSPFVYWRDEFTPEPMIAALEAVAASKGGAA